MAYGITWVFYPNSNTAPHSCGTIWHHPAAAFTENMQRAISITFPVYGNTSSLWRGDCSVTLLPPYAEKNKKSTHKSIRCCEVMIRKATQRNIATAFCCRWTCCSPQLPRALRRVQYKQMRHKERQRAHWGRQTQTTYRTASTQPRHGQHPPTQQRFRFDDIRDKKATENPAAYSGQGVHTMAVSLSSTSIQHYKQVYLLYYTKPLHTLRSPETQTRQTPPPPCMTQRS